MRGDNKVTVVGSVSVSKDEDHEGYHIGLKNKNEREGKRELNIHDV